MVDLLAEAFDAVELSDEEWASFEASRAVENVGRDVKGSRSKEQVA